MFLKGKKTLIHVSRMPVKDPGQRVVRSKTAKIASNLPFFSFALALSKELMHVFFKSISVTLVFCISIALKAFRF